MKFRDTPTIRHSPILKLFVFVSPILLVLGLSSLVLGMALGGFSLLGSFAFGGWAFLVGVVGVITLSVVAIRDGRRLRQEESQPDKP